MIIRFYYIAFVFVLFNCKTYKTFYQKTENADTIYHNNNIYRIKVKRLTQFLNIDAQQLQKLASLNISKLNSEALDSLFKLIPQPDKLRVLIIDSLPTPSTIPNSILKFKNLKQLSILHSPSTNFESLFLNIQNLPLEFLNLQHNKLSHLPKTITYLNDLKDLNLSHNNISNSTLHYLTALPKLKSLWLTNNKLKALPIAITQLKQLRNLYIEQNTLKTLPEDLVKLKKLWVLHAGYNNFSIVPQVLSKMDNLLLLHINNNPIGVIPNQFSSKKLSILGLVMDNNNLSKKDKIKWKKVFRKFFVLSL